MKIAVLTSGGDAPGMNAAVRAVVRTGLTRGWEVVGVRQGNAGLIAGRFVELGARDVGGIIQQGGTVLGSARSPEFRTPEGQETAVRALGEAGVSGLVAFLIDADATPPRLSTIGWVVASALVAALLIWLNQLMQRQTERSIVWDRCPLDVRTWLVLTAIPRALSRSRRW